MQNIHAESCGGVIEFEGVHRITIIEHRRKVYADLTKNQLVATFGRNHFILRQSPSVSEKGPPPQFTVGDSPHARLDRVEAFTLGTRYELTRTVAAVREARSQMVNRGLNAEVDAVIDWFARNLLKPGQLPRANNDTLSRAERVGLKAPNQLTRMSKMIADADGADPITVRFRTPGDETIIAVNRNYRIENTPDGAANQVRREVKTALSNVPASPARSLIARLAMSYFPEPCDDPELLEVAQELLYGVADIEHRNGLAFVTTTGTTATLFRKLESFARINPLMTQGRRAEDTEPPIDFDSLATELVEALSTGIRRRRNAYMDAAIPLRVKIGTTQRIRVDTCVKLLEALEQKREGLRKNYIKHHDSLVAILKRILGEPHEGDFLTFAQYNKIMEPPELVEDTERRSQTGNRFADSNVTGIVS